MPLPVESERVRSVAGTRIADITRDRGYRRSWSTRSCVGHRGGGGQRARVLSIRETETSIDDIATKSELPSGTVSSTLLRLELKRLVKQLPGKYFVKLG